MPINVYGGDVNILNYVEPGAEVRNDFSGTVNFGSDLKKVGESQPMFSSRDEQLRDVARRFLPHVEKNARLWFCLCKAMMWREDAVDGDFPGAVARLRQAFGGELPCEIDAKDISRLNVLSFSYTIDRWNQADSPFKRGNDFLQYHGLATMAYKLLDRQLLRVSPPDE